jgi:Endonuclease/Exonuclease/phosphatase family
LKRRKVHFNRPALAVLTDSCRTFVPSIDSTASVVELHRYAGSLGYCLLNIRFVTDKTDHVVELRRDVSADFVCLVGTWHDSDGLPLSRLHSMVYTVIDRPRPRLRNDLSSNHGGIVILSVPGVRLTVLLFASPPSFELLCVRVISGCSSDILVVVYQPGSESVQQQFFGDLSAVLKRAATYSAPVYVVGDFNIRLDRQEDPITQQFCSLLSGFEHYIADTGPTHSRGGALDAVAFTFPVGADVIDVASQTTAQFAGNHAEALCQRRRLPAHSWS